MNLLRLSHPAALAVPLVAVLLGTAACAADAPVASSPSAGSAPVSATAPSAPSASPAEAPSAKEGKPIKTQKPRPLPSSHVHAVSMDPGTGDVLVASHEGLYVYGEGESRRVGPNIDLMGFTVAGTKHYFASGHPGPGVDLPQPVGLIESRDGGQSWTVLSRGGSSDFHALAAREGEVVGFDGALRISSDGRRWKAGNLTSPPRALAVSPDGHRVLATTADGLMRSTDGGTRWSAVKGAPLLLLVDWADGNSVAGVGTDGTVQVSDDGGSTWRGTGLVANNVQALGATGSGTGLSVFAATSDQLMTWTAKELLVGQP